MNQTPTTTLIIVAYGQPALTELLLDSIAQHTPEPHEVIVVDNDSPDDSAQRVANHPSRPYLIHAPTNLGYGGGVNLGVRKSNSKTLVIMNSDLQVTPNWWTPLTAAIELDSTTIAAPIYTDEQDHIIESGASITVDGHVHTSQTPVHGVKPVDHVSAACWAIDKQSFESLGGFDPAYGLGYYEDLDLINTHRLEKCNAVVVGDSKVIHHTGGSFQTTDANRLSHRNHARSAFRWQWLYKDTSRTVWDGESSFTHGRVAVVGDQPEIIRHLQTHNISVVTVTDIEQLQQRSYRDDVIVVQSDKERASQLAPRAEITTPDDLPNALQRAGIHPNTRPPRPRFSSIAATRSRRW
ncbi:MAG: glycosyltransferase family 2 protein [Acidimicrobiales bacterium]|nr:glycosyltransferase family 2 protein [Acidimicrobiales bacterium]